MTESSPKLSLTPRSLVIGLLLATASAAATTYLAVYVRVNVHGYYFAKMGHVVLFLLVVGINPALKLIRSSWVLGRGELVVIFILMALANSSEQIIGHWGPLVSSPVYQATPENQWLLRVIPSIPETLILHDLAVSTAFFEGYDEGSSGVPWDVWIAPLC